MGLTGCSLLTHTPRHVRLQIKGLGNHVNEFILPLEDTSDSNTDIAISDRYAIKLDLQWLWLEHEDIQYFSPKPDETDANSTSLRPWLLGKFRF